MALEKEDTHYFTQRGALCSARIVYRWSVDVASTTCPACRELLQARDQFEAETNARGTILLGRFGGGP